MATGDVGQAQWGNLVRPQYRGKIHRSNGHGKKYAYISLIPLVPQNAPQESQSTERRFHLPPTITANMGKAFTISLATFAALGVSPHLIPLPTRGC